MDSGVRLGIKSQLHNLLAVWHQKSYVTNLIPNKISEKWGGGVELK